MPAATPNITLTATLDTLSGTDAGSTPNPARILIALCNFGLGLPRIIGTSNLAKIGPYEVLDTGSGISTPLWGNDQIDPAGTFYTIAVFDGDGNAVQCASYRFTGGPRTIDLSNATPIIPTNALGYSATRGAYPGTAYSAPGPIVVLFYNGVALDQSFFTTSPDGATATLTFSTTSRDKITALVAVLNAGALLPGSWLLQWTGCTGAVPGSAYVAPAPAVAVAKNGVLLIPIIDYTTTGGVNIALTNPTVSGDTIDALSAI